MKKTKVLAFAMVTLLAVGLFAGCGNKGEQVLTMATEATFPPYEYMDGTKVVGVDVDVATEIAKEMGMELRVETMNFDAVIPAINSGKADFGAAGMSITPDRMKQVDFSVEYAVSMQVFITRSDSGFTGETDLAGKNIGVQLGTVADLALTEDYEGVNVVRNKKYTDLAMELQNGRIDAILLDALPAQAMQKQNADFVILDEPLFEDSYAICVKKGNTELLETINTVLTRLMDEGKIAQFTTTHLG